MYEAVRRLRPDRAIEAAGYVRVSLERQAGGQSPEVQREAIRRLAAQEGYALTLIEEDHERGSKVTRTGYHKSASNCVSRSGPVRHSRLPRLRGRCS